MIARNALINFYLEFLNDYILVETFAEHNGLTKEQALILINLGREVFNSKHPDA